MGRFIMDEDLEVSFCKALQMLVDEHTNILRLLNLAEYLMERSEITPNSISILNEIIYYIKNYADKYHHAKEENILFKKGDSVATIIKVMLSEHEESRGYVSQAVLGIETNNQAQIKQAMTAYIELLRNHIDKENNILYPYFERNLSNGEKNELEQKFIAANNNLDTNLENNLIKFLNESHA